MRMFSTAVKNRRKRQQGSSVVLVLLFLMALSAAGMGMMYASNIDTLVNANYKQSVQAYYASKAGLEEARDRLRGGANAITPPTVMPSKLTTGGVIYILNPDNNGGDTPWLAGTKYFDDELCHENFGGLSLGGPFTANVPCQGQVGGTYYTTTASIDPNTGTSAVVAYKWVRITLKQAGSTNPWCSDGTCTNTTGEVCAQRDGNETGMAAGTVG